MPFNGKASHGEVMTLIARAEAANNNASAGSRSSLEFYMRAPHAKGCHKRQRPIVLPMAQNGFGVPVAKPVTEPFVCDFRSDLMFGCFAFGSLNLLRLSAARLLQGCSYLGAQNGPRIPCTNHFMEPFVHCAGVRCTREHSIAAQPGHKCARWRSPRA